jgi:hypothetical protein
VAVVRSLPKIPADIRAVAFAGLPAVAGATARAAARPPVRRGEAEILAANWPDSLRDLFGRLGLPDADTASMFAASRLAIRHTQLSDADHAEVVCRLGWAAEELGYPAKPLTGPAGLLACGQTVCRPSLTVPSPHAAARTLTAAMSGWLGGSLSR